jgi:KaiC/GvpD/RAD55 family RecA-like ATPase
VKTRLVPLDISGLDLVLGGGLWTVARMPDVPESTTVLVRGAPGAGKTVFGSQLAGSVARSLGGDVAYGCIELLPVEFQAQHGGLRREGVAEEVVIPPFKKGRPSKESSCRFFAGLLDLGASGDEQSQLGPAVDALLNQIVQTGGSPRVLVIDSLSDGYNLGGSAPRQLADALCKLAVERGLVLILLEEVADFRPSVWSFAVDVVLELRSAEGNQGLGMPDSLGRRLTVIKNRFGPSDAGPHRFSISPEWGLSILPRPSVYLESWARSVLWKGWSPPAPVEQSWSVGSEVDSPKWPRFRECVTAVYGAQAQLVFRVANRLGRKALNGQPIGGACLLIDFSRQWDSRRDKTYDYRAVGLIPAGNPYLSGHHLVAAVRGVLQGLVEDAVVVEKALIGDLRSIRGFREPEEIRRAVSTVVAMLRQVGVPTVLFETVTPRAGEAEPESVDFADAVVSIPFPSTPPSFGVILTDIRTGLRHTWSESL